jgi:hypothetical protein
MEASMIKPPSDPQGWDLSSAGNFRMLRGLFNSIILTDPLFLTGKIIVHRVAVLNWLENYLTAPRHPCQLPPFLHRLCLSDHLINVRLMFSTVDLLRLRLNLLQKPSASPFHIPYTLLARSPPTLHDNNHNCTMTRSST